MNQIANNLLPAAILAALAWVSLRLTKSIDAACLGSCARGCIWHATAA